MTPQQAMKAILEEVAIASKKFPTWPTDAVHASAVVAEESGELTRAALQFNYENGGALSMMDEAIQTGAMAVRFLMSMEKYEITDTEQHRQD
jgi:hypothetical protein